MVSWFLLLFYIMMSRKPDWTMTSILKIFVKVFEKGKCNFFFLHCIVQFSWLNRHWVNWSGLKPGVVQPLWNSVRGILFAFVLFSPEQTAEFLVRLLGLPVLHGKHHMAVVTYKSEKAWGISCISFLLLLYSFNSYDLGAV